MHIVGAGLAGLLAANLFPNASVFEKNKRPNPHRALLRFRTPEIGNSTGIDFRPVTVRKGIYYQTKFHLPDISLCNYYSQKLLGIVADRSIWNIEPVTRYIAPEDLHEQLLDRANGRINYEVDYFNCGANISRPVISTMPLPDLLTALNIEHGMQFKRAAIRVERYRIPNCDVYQTIYFPSPETSLYRASITKDLLIVESASEDLSRDQDAERRWEEVSAAFGIYNASYIDSSSARFGKIADIEDRWRRAMIHRLTTDCGIYSLGRFATWRNILLDDVLKDIGVIKRLIHSDGYAHSLARK